MNLSINRWVLKNKQHQAAAFTPSCPFGSHWLLLRPECWEESRLTQMTMMLSISPLTQPFYSFSSLPSPLPRGYHPSLSLPLSVSLLGSISCHHFHLNPVCRGPDPVDWFPVRRSLKRILELYVCVHPPLLHSNLKGRPCLLFSLCWTHTHTQTHTQYIYKSLHKERHTSTWSSQYSKPSKGSFLIAKYCYYLLCLNEFYWPFTVKSVLLKNKWAFHL